MVELIEASCTCTTSSRSPAATAVSDPRGSAEPTATDVEPEDSVAAVPG
ncbi:MAG: hypothetical protein IPJ28_18420 [Betaproteobacteria bacterium]|nr:hypothetical protein [Betaproteobacteria bacterium]